MNDYSKLDKILNDYSDMKGTLIPILQKTQEAYGFLSQEAMKYIADHLKMSAADVFGVATFYAQFRFAPVGKNILKVCHGTACHVGGINILDAMLNNKLGINPGETTKDGLFTILHVACLGCCSLAPVIMVNETTYGKLTNDKLSKIIDKYAEGKTI